MALAYKPRLPILNRHHPLSRGLLAAWLLYEGSGTVVRDVSGRGLHGTLTGGSWASGPDGPMLYSNNSCFQIAANTVFNLNTGPLSFVFRLQQAETQALTANFVIREGNSGYRARYLTNGDLRAQSPSTNFITTATGLALVGVWYTVGVVFGSTGLRIYLDGILRASNTTGTGSGNSGALYIGEEPLLSDEGLRGYYDTVLCYKRELAGAEMRLLYNDLWAAFRPNVPVPVILGTAATLVTLNWTDNSTGEDGFRIERSTDGVNFTEIDTVGPGVELYEDDTVEAGTLYYYRVRAYDAASYSGYSNTVSITP